MGLMTWPGTRPSKPDAVVAKDYLNTKGAERFEPDRVAVSRLRRTPGARPSRDDDAGLDRQVSEREILTHAGSVSHEVALAKAEAEFEKFRRVEDAKPSPVEQHFIEAIEQVKQLEKGKRAKKKKP